MKPKSLSYSLLSIQIKLTFQHATLGGLKQPIPELSGMTATRRVRTVLNASSFWTSRLFPMKIGSATNHIRNNTEMMRERAFSGDAVSHNMEESQNSVGNELNRQCCKDDTEQAGQYCSARFTKKSVDRMGKKHETVTDNDRN